MRALSVTLEAVIVAVADETPRVLLVDSVTRPALPSGPLDPDGDETLTLGLRRLVAHQTGIDVTYVEQLYTFGDRNRSLDEGTRDLAVGYVALTDAATTAPRARWVGDDPQRMARERITFGAGAPWDPIRVLERYELLFEAGLVAEAGGDGESTGTALVADHRRIAATALGRLRGKLTYRPVIFEVMPDLFTLTHLQTTVEAIIGIRLHKQNFRRIVERNDLVEPTGAVTTATGGRPAELFRFRSEVVSQRPRPGFPLPRPKNL